MWLYSPAGKRALNIMHQRWLNVTACGPVSSRANHCFGGSQPFTMPQRSPVSEPCHETHIRDPFYVLLADWAQDVMLQFEAVRHAVHGPYKIAVKSSGNSTRTGQARDNIA
jgi:hypothetical protein